MSRSAKKICANVDKSVKDQAVTLANAVLAMQEKIDKQIPVYASMSLAQTVEKGDGKKILRQNPAVAEFRATVRDYASALKDLNEILDENKKPAEANRLYALRERFKVQA